MTKSCGLDNSSRFSRAAHDFPGVYTTSSALHWRYLCSRNEFHSVTFTASKPDCWESRVPSP